MKQFLILAGWLFCVPAYAQSAGDYRSNVTSGNWNTVASWQRYNGTAWVAASATPTSADGAIEIRTGHTITVTANVTVDQVTINGTLTVNGVTLSAGPAASTITVNSGGVVNNNSGTIGGTATGNLFNAGSLYVHDSSNSNGGVVPTATWDVASTLRIAFSGNTSYTLTSTSWSQAFGNVEINITSPGNRTNNFAGLLTTVNGNFSFLQNTQQAGSTLNLSSSGSNSLTIGGNFTMSAARTLTIASGGSNTINVAGNFSVGTGGTLTTIGTGNINFNGSGNTQFYTRNGTISGAVNFTVASGSIVDAGTNSFTGSGTFTLNGELRTGSATGLNGTLVNSGTKTFNGNCTVHYNGTVAQVMGTLYPTSPPSGMNVVINNGSGVTSSVSTTIVAGILNLIQGNLNVASGHTLQLQGTLARTAGYVSMNSNSSLTINGSGSLGVSPFPFSTDPTFVNLTVNRSAGTVDFLNNVTLNGTATFTAGTLTFYNSQFTWSGPVNFAGGLVAGNGSSTLTINGSGSISTINFATGGNTLSTLNLNRSGANISLSGDLTITSTMNIQIGNLNGGSNTIVMQGSSWSIDNLSGGSFTPNSSLVIFDGNTSVTGTSAILFNHIQLNASRTLSMPSATVNISGDINFSSSGTFVHNNGTLLLDGGSTQNIGGGNHLFYNIECNKASGDVQLTSAVRLESVLNVISATNFRSDGHLTLLSTGDDPDQTASIAALLGGAQVTGDVIYQRYMSGEGRIYRYLSSPLSNATVSGWMDDFPVTGVFLNPSTTDPNTGLTVICGSTINSTSPSLYYYNESAPGVMDNGWVAYPATGQDAAATPIVAGRGYAAFIRECTGSTLADLTGTINQGAISLPVTFTGSTSDPDGWNLVGNPYPSRITWDTGPGWTKTNISANVSVRDNGAGGVFQVLDEADGYSIASGQAFWVLATAPGAQLNINENAKTTNGGSFYRSAAQKNILEVWLSKGSITDKAYFKVHPKASRQLDRYDFPNQNNDLFDIGILANNKQLAVHAVDEIQCQEVIQLHIKDMTNGTYQISLVKEGILKDYNAVLIDKFTGTQTILASHTQYSFTINSTTASKAYDRFRIELSTPSIEANRQVDKVSGTVCPGESYTLRILNPQLNVHYFAEINGQPVSDSFQANATDTPLPILIPSDKIPVGQSTVFIQAENFCGKVMLNSTVMLEKSAVVTPTVNTAEVCKGSTATLVAAADGNNTYRWYATYNSRELLYEGSTFVTPPVTAPTTYYVETLNASGCAGNRVGVSVKMIEVEEAIIHQEGRNRLVSNYSSGNQWYFNNQKINGATRSYLTVVKSGTYRVEVKTAKGCQTSATFDFINNRPGDEKRIHLYPNPVKGSDEFIRIEIISSRVENLQILNAKGQVVLVMKPERVEQDLWTALAGVNHLPPGVYFVKVLSEGKVQTIKFIRSE
jgi:hypothetical protein